MAVQSFWRRRKHFFALDRRRLEQVLRTPGPAEEDLSPHSTRALGTTNFSKSRRERRRPADRCPSFSTMSMRLVIKSLMRPTPDLSYHQPGVECHQSFLGTSPSSRPFNPTLNSFQGGSWAPGGSPKNISSSTPKEVGTKVPPTPLPASGRRTEGETARSAQVGALGGEGAGWSSVKPASPGSFTPAVLAPPPAVLVTLILVSALVSSSTGALAELGRAGAEEGVATGPAPACEREVGWGSCVPPSTPEA